MADMDEAAAIDLYGFSRCRRSQLDSIKLMSNRPWTDRTAHRLGINSMYEETIGFRQSGLITHVPDPLRPATRALRRIHA